MLKGRLGLETARVPHADRHGLIYLARGRLYVNDGTLRFRTTGFEELAAGDYGIPFQMLSVLLIGPGAAVTHDAFRLLARHGTGLVAVAEGAVRMYASMPFGPDQSARARRQVALWADEDKRCNVARRMYAWRLGSVLPSTDIAVLRGIEGARVKESYRLIAQQFGINWKGRRYDRSRPDKDDLANQALNHAATAVSAAAMVAVSVAGAIPQLGFIHEDSGRSFPLDIADLFRESVTLPVAFSSAKELRDHRSDDKTVERTVRKNAGRAFRKKKLVSNMITRIKELLDGDDRGRHDSGT